MEAGHEYHVDLDSQPRGQARRLTWGRYRQQAISSRAESKLKAIGLVRDCIEECLRNSGPHFNRALQDLVNFVGPPLEFDVVFGMRPAN
jgi:hypothetical protein